MFADIQPGRPGKRAGWQASWETNNSYVSLGVGDRFSTYYGVYFSGENTSQNPRVSHDHRRLSSSNRLAVHLPVPASAMMSLRIKNKNEELLTHVRP